MADKVTLGDGDDEEVVGSGAGATSDPGRSTASSPSSSSLLASSAQLSRAYRSPNISPPPAFADPGHACLSRVEPSKGPINLAKRTAYVRMYVAACLAVFFLSPHFSKERDPGDTGNGLTYYMLAARREKAPSSPAHSLPLCSAPLASNFRPFPSSPPPRRSNQHRARRRRSERGFAGDDDTGTSTSTKTLAETRTFLPRLLIANA